MKNIKLPETMSWSSDEVQYTIYEANLALILVKYVKYSVRKLITRSENSDEAPAELSLN